MKIEVEHRHADWGPDAGGYSVLRIDGVWIGRIEGVEAKIKVKELTDYLEITRGEEAQAALRKLSQALNNPALEWTEPQTIEDALVSYAIEHIKFLTRTLEDM